MGIDGADQSLRRKGFVAIAALWVGVLSLLTGCEEPVDPMALSRQKVEVEELPEAVRKGAKKAISGVAFKEAWRNVDRAGKVESYELRGRSGNGKIRDVKVSPAGLILETE